MGCVLFLTITNWTCKHFGAHLQSLLFDKHLGVQLLADLEGKCFILLENAKKNVGILVLFHITTSGDHSACSPSLLAFSIVCLFDFIHLRECMLIFHSWF